MNKHYLQIVGNSEEMARNVPNLTLLGSNILRQKLLFSNFENAMSVCGELQTSLEVIREITGVGRGLAANQIGSLERCFITFVDGEFQYFINPEIDSCSEDASWYQENCLSCGPIACDVKRSDEVTLLYIDKEGELQKKTFNSFWARLLQHEYDHLEGIVNIDRADKTDIKIIDFDPLKESLRKTKD